MKKALLAAALMTAGVVAHAQSSVTLYGRLDAGLEYMSGVPKARVNWPGNKQHEPFQRRKRRLGYQPVGHEGR